MTRNMSRSITPLCTDTGYKTLREYLHASRLTEVEVPKDGLCILHAVHGGLQSSHTSTSAQDLSKETVKYMVRDEFLQHVDEYMPYSALSKEDTLAQLESWAQTGQYGSDSVDLILHILSQVLNLRILVVEETISRVTSLELLPHRQDKCSLIPPMTSVILIKHGQHFNHTVFSNDKELYPFRKESTYTGTTEPIIISSADDDAWYLARAGPISSSKVCKELPIDCQSTDIPSTMQQSEEAYQQTDVPTTMQQFEAASQRTDVPTTMQQSEEAYQQTDVPTTLQQFEAASQRTDVPTTMQQSQAAYQITGVPTMMQQSRAAYQRIDVRTMMQRSKSANQWTAVPTTMQQSEAACQRIDVPIMMQPSKSAYQWTAVPTTMQQSAAAYQWTDIPTTMQQSEAAYQRTNVPTMMQQSEAAYQRTDVPTMMQQSEAAFQWTDVPTTMQQSEAALQWTDVPTPTTQQSQTAYQITNVPTMMQQSGAACQQIDVPTMMQQSEAACQRTDVLTTMQQPEAAYQRTDVLTTLQQSAAACQRTDVPTTMQQSEAAYQRTEVLTTLQQSAAACQRTDVPTTMQQSEAAYQRTDVLTMLQQSAAACQRTDVPTTMQHSEAAYQGTDGRTSMQLEAQVPGPSAATDTSQQTGTIGNIGAVGGSHNPIIVGASGVSITNVFPLEGPGVPGPGQEPRLWAPSYQDVGNKTRDILKERYNTTGSYVQLLPGVANDQKHIASIYTKVRLETREGVAVVCTSTGKTATKSSQRGEIVNSIEYDKIFSVRKGTKELIKRLIFVGEGGVGKSTIFDKIAYDWAEGENEFLKRFDLVFLLKMCALCQESDLVESMLNQLLDEDSGIEKDELEKVIHANPNAVLILLDGFDEMMTKTLDEALFGSVLKALNRKKYRQCCICVATRPSRLETLMSTSLVQNPCAHVEVLGFAKEDVNEYVRKFFNEDSDSGEALIQSIEKSNTQRDFAKIPMLLLRMCSLWREHKQLPKTTSRLFNEAVDHMFSTKDKDKERPPDAKKRKPNISNVSKIIPIQIGQIALRGLISDHFSFQEGEFEPEALDLALKAGILTKQSVIKNSKSHNSIQFVHTMQKYCAAKYLQSLKKGEFQRSLEPLCSTIDRVVSNDDLLRFCCGDNKRCMTGIVNLLDHQFNQPPPISRNCFFVSQSGSIHQYITQPMFQSDIIQAISRNCFFESQSSKVPRCLTSDSHIPSTIHVFNNNDFRSLVYLLEIICKSDSGKAQLTCFKLIEVWGVSSVIDLAFALGYMKNLSTLRLNACSLGNSDLVKILSELKCNQQLTHLSLGRCDGLGGRAVEWAPHIKHLTSLNELTIFECKLQAADIEHISSSVSDIPGLTDLSLSSNDLTPTDIKFIASAVGDMPSLTYLNLSVNKTLSELAESWAKELPKITHLKKLDLVDCNLSSTDIKFIASAVGDMPSLTDLDISVHTFSGLLLDKELTKMKHLNKLCLDHCKLLPTDMKHMASAAGDMPRLTDLSLSFNFLCGLLWAEELPKMKHLNKLSLAACGLSRTDMNDIASAAGDMPSLTDLNICLNRFRGSLWAKELPKMKHLNKLNLNHCGLSRTDMKHIATAVGDMPRLTDLDISGNKFGRLSWAKELPKMKHLHKLNLIYCGLSRTDMKHIIISAVGDMLSLSDLYLGSNARLNGLDGFGLQSRSPSLTVHMSSRP